MLTSLKAYKLFDGYRGGPKLDIETLADTIVSVSNIATENKDNILELDMNPVFVYEEGIAVADALLITV